jgi:cobalt-precorrin-5B (C1)-methyltransferase
VELAECCRKEDSALAAVVKDAGDDCDVTDHLLIYARVSLSQGPGIEIHGGAGVGRVTKPGLDQPVGQAAINHVPRQMITQAVTKVCEQSGYEGGVIVTIFIPGGQELAAKTFNPSLGVEGGLSILGTSGIVEPMSTQALLDTISLELRQTRAQGHEDLILTPGNYGAEFLGGQGWDKLGIPVVKCSNFIGDALDEAGLQGFQRILLVGHAGKLVKLAGGIFNTHSRVADCRMELFCAHAALCGADASLCRRLMDCVTCDGCHDLLAEAGLWEPVIASLMAAVERTLRRRSAGAYAVGAVLFSNQSGLWGQTAQVGELLSLWNTKRALSTL